MAALTFYVEG